LPTATTVLYQRIRLGLIDEPGHRLRDAIAPESLGELADSMAAEGLHQPLGVRGPNSAGRYEVVWGHRRLLAARLLCWPDVPARVFPAAYDPLLAAVSENLQRTDLNPLEEARAVAAFQERGKPLAEIQRLFRRSMPWVQSRIDLLHFPPDVQAAVGAGRLTLAVARELATIDHDTYRGQLVAEAERTGATSRTAEVWTAHYRADRDRIIANTITVEDVIARREAWKIYVACELCEEDTPYEETRGLRACRPCLAAVAELVQRAAAEAAAG